MCWRIVWKPWVMTQEQVRRPVSLNSHKPQNYIIPISPPAERKWVLTSWWRLRGILIAPRWDWEDGLTRILLLLTVSLQVRLCSVWWTATRGCHHTERTKYILLATRTEQKLFWLQSHCIKSLNRQTFLSPVGGSSEHHCQPGPSEGIRFQELQLPARGPPSLPWRLPAPALAGHQSNISRPWLLPGVHAGRWSPPGQSPLGEGVRGQVSDAKHDSYF